MIFWSTCFPSSYETAEGIEYQVIGHLRLFDQPDLDAKTLRILEPNQKVKSIALFPYNWHRVIIPQDGTRGFVHQNGLKRYHPESDAQTQISWTKRAQRQSLEDDVMLSQSETRAERLSLAMDYTNSLVRDFALEHIQHGGERNIYQVCDLFDALMDQWTYVSDTTHVDYYAKASESIQLGLKGDCDDYAVLLVSLILSIGGGARIVSACDPDEGCHAYAEVFLTTVKEEAISIHRSIMRRYRPNEDWNQTLPFHLERASGTYWLNLDWWNDYPGGKVFGKRKQAIYANGCYELYDNEERMIAQGCVP